MSFTNEYLSAKDKERFDWVQMPRLRWQGDIGMRAPTFWTVNQQQDAFLICTQQGREEDADRFDFLLWWKEKPWHVSMRQQFVGPKALVWHLGPYPNELANQFDEFIEVLKDAMRAFGSSGSPERWNAGLDVELKYLRPKSNSNAPN
jgi:hypothetical protein